MGTVQHHESRSADFLRDAIAAAGPESRHAHNHALAEAAEYLSRAASHAVTALAVHGGFRHNTAKRLQFVLQESIYMERLRRGHLRIFRQTYALPAVLDLPNIGRVSPKAAAKTGDGAGDDDADRPINYRPHHRRRPETAGHRPLVTPIQTIRRLGRRVNALRKAIVALIEGRAKPIQRAQRSSRYDPGDLPPVTDNCGIICYTGEITRLPNFASFPRRFDLADTPMSTSFDGIIPRLAAARRRVCRCTPEPRHTLGDHKEHIILTAEWRAALTQAYPHLKIPQLVPV